MQRDLCAVRFQKVLAVSGLAVGVIDRTCLGVVDDVRFQHRDFCQLLLRCFNGIAQFMIAGSGSVHTLLHFLDAVDFVFLQENQCPGHLF